MNVTSRYNPANIYYRKIECPAQDDRKIKGDRKENCVKTNLDLKRFDPTPGDNAITVDDYSELFNKLGDAMSIYEEVYESMCPDESINKKECQQHLDLFREKIETEREMLFISMYRKGNLTAMEIKNLFDEARRRVKRLVPFIEYDRTTKVGKVMQSFDPKPDGFIFDDEYDQIIGNIGDVANYIVKIFDELLNRARKGSTILYEPGSRYNIP